MAEILLVHPRVSERSFGGMPPLGFAWIAAYLEKNGYNVDIFDLQVYSGSIEEVIRNSKPRIVGITGTSNTRFMSFDIARTARKIDENIFTVYGGAHATFTAKDTLENLPEIDAVVSGEGEETMLEIAEAVLRGKTSLSDITGLSYRKNGTIIHNPVRPRIRALESLPLPARHLMNMKDYDLKMDFLDISGASVMTSRGCPINCSYCSASAMFGKTLSLRSAKNVVDEIEILLTDYEAKGIKFFDSTLTLKRGHINSLCDEIMRRRLKFPWECEIRVNTVSRDLLKMMKEAGCYYVDFGVESASPGVLKAMRKGITIDQVIDVFHWTKDLGILTKVFFTFGHIQETLEDAMATLDFIDKHNKYITSPGIGVGIKIYPGTQVERYAYEIGCLDAGFSWAVPYHSKEAEFMSGEPNVPLLIQPQMGFKELRKVRYQLLKKRLKDPIGIFKSIKDAWSKDNLKKVWTIAKGMIQTRFSN
ncbi:MAG: radical SAM protein [Thermodesulfobacteriota bacterium]|nr:radical SAM protein [Thermodesulfobacteriota bacterium]